MGKRKHKSKSDHPHKKKKKHAGMAQNTNTDEAAAAAAAGGATEDQAGASVATAAAQVPSLTNMTAKCFAKRGPRRGATFFHLNDVQDVALYCMGLGKLRKPVCVNVTNPGAIPKVAMVLVSGMTTALFARLGDQLPKCRELLTSNSCYPFLTPGKTMFVKQDVASAFLDVKLSPQERTMVEGMLPPEMLKTYSSADPESFMLSLRDLSWFKYPLRTEWYLRETGAFYQSDLLRNEFFTLPSREATQTGGQSSDAGAASQPSAGACDRNGQATLDDADSAVQEPPAAPMFAIDCEMCKTASEYVLTRIAVVNEDLECVFQTLVKPNEPITDYVTQYSGITEEMLADVTTRLEDVQTKLAEILPHNAVLVGHSLENDLMALKVTHRRIIDTSILFSEGGIKQKLRVLAKHVLKIEIQQQDSGHDPTEDAVATMKLAKFFLTEGCKTTKFAPGVSMFTLADMCKRKGAVVDLPLACSKHCRGEAEGYPVFSDEEAVTKAIKALPNSDLLWTRLSNIRHCIVGQEPLDWDAVTKMEDLKEAVRSVDDNLYKLYSALPEHSVLLVMFDHGDIRELSRHKQAHPSDMEGYETKVKRCRTSMFFTCLKETEDTAAATSSGMLTSSLLSGAATAAAAT